MDKKGVKIDALLHFTPFFIPPPHSVSRSFAYFSSAVCSRKPSTHKNIGLPSGFGALRAQPLPHIRKKKAASPRLRGFLFAAKYMKGSKMNKRIVFLGGSRDLISGEVVGVLVGAALSRGLDLRTGCAQGADALVVSSVLAAGAADRLSVFAAFNASGSDVPVPSDRAGVFSAKAAGSRVFFSAFSGPARARLAARSRAALVGVSLACWFLSPSSSATSGSLKAAAFAVKSGIPVVVFSCGFSVVPPSLLGCPGSWLRLSLWGFPCWRWLPKGCEKLRDGVP